jgi:predicted ribosome quality control (RQC) complex YloA/Tae2 family protein
MINLHNDSFTIIIGRNAEENWEILEQANKEDIWVHLNEHASPHIIIKKNNNYKLKPKDIKLAGILCKQYSRYKKDNDIEYCYTKVKNVRKGDKVGEVILDIEPNIKRLRD